MLPSLCCFPSANRGFTFSTWICPKLASGAYSYRSRKPSRDNRDSKAMSEKLVRPVLLSLLQQNGEGITLHLEPKNCNASCDGTRRVVLTVWPPAKASRRPCSVGAALLTNDDDSNRGSDDDEDDIIWHHIAVKVHSSTYRSRGDVVLVVNGVSFSLVQALQDSRTARVSSSSSKVFSTDSILRHALCYSDAVLASCKYGGLVMPSPTIGDIDPAHASTFAKFMNIDQSFSSSTASEALGDTTSEQKSPGTERAQIEGQRNREVATSLCGRLGAIYFFDGPISDAAIKGIYGLGPRYRHLFDLTEFRDLYMRAGVTAGGGRAKVLGISDICSSRTL